MSVDFFVGLVLVLCAIGSTLAAISATKSFDLAFYWVAFEVGVVTWLCVWRIKLYTVLQLALDIFLDWFLLQQLLTRVSAAKTLDSDQYAAIGSASGGIILYGLGQWLSRCTSSIFRRTVPFLNTCIAAFAILYFNFSGFGDDWYLFAWGGVALVIGLLSHKVANFRAAVDSFASSVLIVYSLYQVTHYPQFTLPADIFGDIPSLYAAFIGLAVFRLIVQFLVITCRRTRTVDAMPIATKSDSDSDDDSPPS